MVSFTEEDLHFVQWQTDDKLHKKATVSYEWTDFP